MRRFLGVATVVVLALVVQAFAAATYPAGVKVFVRKNPGDTVLAQDVNELQEEVEAVESDLVNGLSRHWVPRTTRTYDMGSSTLLWRDANIGRTLTVTQGTIATDLKGIDGSGTWNSAGTTFTFHRVNITCTACAAASKFVEYQLAGVAKYLVDKDGGLTSGLHSITGAAPTDDALRFDVTGDTQRRFIADVDGRLQWGPGNAVQDVALSRSAANELQFAADDALSFRQNAATNLALVVGVVGDTVNRLTVEADGRIRWGPGNAATDVDLYRGSANVLRTGDQFEVNRALTTDIAMSALVAAESQTRFVVRGDGKTEWGPGNAALDTNLYRAAANILATDDLFKIIGAVIGSQVFQLAVSGEAAVRLDVLADGTIRWGDGTNPVDVSLSRTAANVLALAAGDEFSTPGGLTIGGGTKITKHANGSAALNFGSISAGQSSELSVTVTGAVLGDPAYCSPNGNPTTEFSWSARVSAADTVRVRLTNASIGPVDPDGAGFTWKCDLWQH